MHSSYGHLYVLANNRRSRRSARRSRTPRCSGSSPRGWASTSPASATATRTIARSAFCADHPAARVSTGTQLQERWLAAAQRAFAVRAICAGQVPDAVGQVRVLFESLRRRGLDPLPTFTPPRESAPSNPDVARRFPLAMISPPARNALNSTFANLPVFVEQREDALARHPSGRRGGAADRRRRQGARVQRSRRACADRARHRQGAARCRGGAVDLVAQALAGRHNANAVTGQALTDLGRAATFYDCLVEVETDRAAVRRPTRARAAVHVLRVARNVRVPRARPARRVSRARSARRKLAGSR